MIDRLRINRTESYSEIMQVTPDMAAAWLEKNEDNRPINRSLVSQLARDMKAGRFACTHQGIAFDIHGRLIDGQHRLWAILEADVPVWMRVFFNEPPDNVVCIDGNYPRRAADRMTLSRTLGTVRADELATLRAMIGGIGLAHEPRTVLEELELLQRHRDAVQFAHQHLSVTRLAGLTNAMTRAVIARAWYCVVDRAGLSRFCHVLRTGLAAAASERVVVLLRDQLTELGTHGNGKAVRQRQYALTSRALAAYVDSQPLTILRATTCELFILPEEVA